MNKKLLLGFRIALACTILISGCVEQLQPEENKINQQSIRFTDLPDELQKYYQSSWPADIPEDIPELEGEISIVMNSDTHYRIFYENMNERHVHEYLDQLEKEGFHLKYFVYEDPWDNPEDTAAKIKRGEWDFVRITKDDYRMRLEGGTYDIDKTWIEPEAKETVVLQWPQELDGLVPPPERSVITDITTISDGSLRILCQVEDETGFDDYLQLLQEVGFTELSRKAVNPSQTAIDIRLSDGVTTMDLDISKFSNTMEIRVWGKSVWPEELDGLVPPPQRCEITSVTSISDGLHVMCLVEDGTVFDEYLQLLKGAGFTEQSREVLDPAEELIDIKLSDGVTTVILFINKRDDIMEVIKAW